MPRTIDYENAVSKIRAFYEKSGRLPSFSEIQNFLGYSSKGGVSILVDRLIERGFLSKDKTGRLIPGEDFSPGIKLLGSVQAGIPSPEEEQKLDTVSIEKFLITKPEATFLVQVSGDSMIEAGIMPRDLVLIEKGRAPQSGDIVVAQVDGEWTLKYFRRRNGKTFLEAANPKYAPIHPKKELIIGGIVIANVRKYI